MEVEVETPSTDEDSPTGDVAPAGFIRRQSTASNLSRHSSCPDLPSRESLCGKFLDSNYVPDVVDTSDRSKTAKKPKRRIPSEVCSISPLIRRRLHLNDAGDLNNINSTQSEHSSPSSTPTFSRRQFASTEVLAESKENILLDSPSSTPRAFRRPNVVNHPVSRTSSCELNAESSRMSSISSISERNNLSHAQSLNLLSPHVSRPSLPLSAENLQKFEHFQDVMEGAAYAMEQSDDVAWSPTSEEFEHYDPRSGEIYVTEDSSSKCQKWLESLHISQRERIKSRSHIQLPPL